MRFATLLSWLVTVSLGAFMLRTWLARDGLRRERAREGGLPPHLIFGHAGLALIGLLLWIGYLASGARPLAWAGVGALMVTVCLGLCTVTLWTPYPARRPGELRAPGTADAPAATPDTAEVSATAALVRASSPTADADDDDDDDQAAYPAIDELIARLLADPVTVKHPRSIRPNPAVLVPVVHGFGAIATFVLAVMTAIG
jgi:hypothetical protein